VWGTPPPNASGIPGDDFAPNEVAGTDGDYVPRMHPKWWQPIATEPAQHIMVFVDMLWRHIPFRLREEPMEFAGLKLAAYHIPLNASSNDAASEFPYNAAYDMFGARAMINATMIQGGAPIFLCNPHFLGAGEEAADRIEGMSPDAAKHQTVLGIEINSGFNVASYQRLQVNVGVHKVHHHDNTTWFDAMLPGITYVPLAWFDIPEVATPESAKQLRDGLQTATTMYVASIIVGAMLSAICFVGAVLCSRRRVVSILQINADSQQEQEQQQAAGGQPQGSSWLHGNISYTTK
jgi:hypothetical protein